MTLSQRICLQLRELGRGLVSWIPAAPGTALRILAYRPFFKQASFFRFGVGVVILGFKNISLGRGVALNRYASLTADRGVITLGDNVYVGDFCTISGDDGEVVIGNNVLIGSGAKVLGPFKVGDNSRIASNAVVLMEIPDNSTAVGVPARIVKIAGQKINYTSEVDHIHINDPMSNELICLREQVCALTRIILKQV